MTDVMTIGARWHYAGDAARGRVPGMISCIGLRYAYRSFEAVAGVDLHVPRGEVVALLGTNGAGKTTVVDLIRGHLTPAAGQVRVLGRDPVRFRRDLAPLVGVVPQDSGFTPALTVTETLRLWARLAGRPLPAGGVSRVLAEVGLEQRADVRVRRLSGGERRRLDLAVAVAGDPELLLLDEPTAGLDPESRDAAWALIGRRRAAGATVLLTTHHLEEAEAYADRFAVLHRGRIAATGVRGDDPAAVFRAVARADAA
jgi:ABC-2 type transport system ATP-binding protein